VDLLWVILSPLLPFSPSDMMARMVVVVVPIRHYGCDPDSGHSDDSGTHDEPKLWYRSKHMSSKHLVRLDAPWR
jgi:hypothetical protein